MNEVTRPVRPRGSILSAVATVSALALFLIFASSALGASESLTGGTTDLTLTKGFKKKLANNDVRVLGSGSGTVSNRTVELGVSGGEIDTTAGQGHIDHAGGFKLKRGKRTAAITAVTIELSGRAVFAKVANSKMKLGSLSPISYTRNGLTVDVGSGGLKLTGKAAKRLNEKLGLDHVLKGTMSNSQSAVQVKAATPAKPQPPAAGGEMPKGTGSAVVGTMTRNLYLGADLTPAIVAPNLKAFVAANGKILREVTHNDFPTRAQGLAQEILEKSPDLVGLQEVALWRTAPVNFGVLSTGPSATTVRYDYLQELLDELNAEGTHYEVVVVQNEFDLEAPADEDGNPATGPEGADINGRLTMRDVILKRSGAGVETSHAEGANFHTLLPIPIFSGDVLLIKRGWTATDASVRGSRPFRFVNTHLEAFEEHIRAAQAAELVEPPGPATGTLPVILVGDLNSDDNTTPKKADSWAFNILTVAGFVDLSTESPMSCCIDASELGETDGGEVSDFDHHIDHVMTNDPDDVQLLGSEVTGRLPVNGFWDSDHAGVFSSLEILP
jgi:endonuclease/exonuclease/phosphatase family metal-dependent hydrolase